MHVLEHPAPSDSEVGLAHVARHDDIGRAAVGETDATPKVEYLHPHPRERGLHAHDLAAVVRGLDPGEGVGRCRLRQHARHGDDGDEQSDGQATGPHTTTSTLATTWVMAGTAHEPVAHRCHDRSAPAARSIGSTHTP